MGIFSRRKDPKKAAEVTKATQDSKVRTAAPQLRLNVTSCSMPELESSTETVATSTPPTVTQRPCLKRASNSENSIYLTMYAASNRFVQSSQRISGIEESAEHSKSSSRSSSTSRVPKQVSFKLDNEDRLLQPQRDFASCIGTPLKPPLPPRSPHRLSSGSSSSEGDDWHDAKSIASSVTSVSSWTTIDSRASASSKLAIPRQPSHVASGFERRMSKLPPVQSRGSHFKPKISLSHSKNGQPSWHLKSKPRALVAH